MIRGCGGEINSVHDEKKAKDAKSKAMGKEDKVERGVVEENQGEEGEGQGEGQEGEGCEGEEGKGW